MLSRYTKIFICLILMQVLHPFAQNPAQSQSRSYALLIASGRYSDPATMKDATLKGCSSDVALIASLLRWKFRFPVSNIHLVGLDGTERSNIAYPYSLAGENATFATIESGFQWLKRVAKPDDTVVIYYSGHGTQVHNPDPQSPELDYEALVPYDVQGLDRLISDRQLKEWVQQIPSRKKTVILDTCHSGGMLRARGDDDPEGLKGERVSRCFPITTGSRASAPQSVRSTVQNPPAHTVFLSACGANEKTFEKELRGGEERDNIYVGEFTWALYQTLCKSTGNLSPKELQERIIKRLRERNYLKQNPVLTGTNDCASAISSSAQNEHGVRLPIIRRVGRGILVDAGWLAGIRNKGNLITKFSLPTANSTASLYLSELGWFRSRLKSEGEIGVLPEVVCTNQLP